MGTMLENLLKSGVLIAIVTGVFGVLSWKFSGKLKHIVEERRAWRDSLREIISNINESEYPQSLIVSSDKQRLMTIKKNISDLEVRLNTLHLSKKTSSTFDGVDYYIWETIDSIYNKTTLDSLIKSGEIKRVRRFISLLLKEDWDRSKKEVVGERKLLSSFGQITLFLSIYASLIFQFHDLFFSDNINLLVDTSISLIALSVSLGVKYGIDVLATKLFLWAKYLILFVPMSLFGFSCFFTIKDLSPFVFEVNNKETFRNMVFIIVFSLAVASIFVLVFRSMHLSHADRAKYQKIIEYIKNDSSASTTHLI